jgi:dedicator of cytokinesis protein 3
LEAIDRHQANVVAVRATPVVYPVTSPSPLIAPPAQDAAGGVPAAALNNTLGEVAAVILVMLVVQPIDGIKAFLDEQLEVEGAANFNRTLLSLFSASSSILRYEAFPRNWLNISLLAHTAILKCLRLLSSTMIELNLPDLTASAAELDLPLWSACLETHFLLLNSDQVVIESFGPQVRRQPGPPSLRSCCQLTCSAETARRLAPGR